MIGEKQETSKVSGYRPTQEWKEFITTVKKDYSIGHDILTRSWHELNDQSVIDDMNRGRRMFNAFVDEGNEDAAEAWKWRGTRSVARNKGIAMHANLTAAYLLPNFQAQNEDSDIDRDVSEFMTDLVEWMAQDENSNYKENFLSLVFAMETDPIVYLGAEYAEVMQEIKIKGEDGRYTKQEIMDEVLSGFKAPIYTADQIMISNAFERNLQKHRCIGKRRWIEYEEAEAKYGDHPNFEYVEKGHSVVYNEDDGLFYEIKDDQHPNLVEEYTPAYRRDDTEVCFLGGIPMGEKDVDNNPIKHRDNFGAPRYNVQHFGYYPIGSHYIFYKSMMAAMRWDNILYDAMAEIGMNRAILEVEMPLAVSGSDKVDSEIIYPNAVVGFEDKDTKVMPLLPSSNLNGLFVAMQQIEDSMSDASVSETMAGQLPAASQKAFSVAQAQANAKRVIGGVAKGLALSVSKYGLLMADIAINHLSVPQVDEIVGDNTKLKYRKFVLNNKEVGGQRMTKTLAFDENLIGAEMDEREKEIANIGLYEKAGEKSAMMLANPEMFAKMKYYARADYKEVFAHNDETMQALMMSLYAQLNADPMIEREALLRETLYPFFHAKADKFIAKQPLGGMAGLPALAPGMQPSQFGNMAANKALSTAAPGAGPIQ